MPAAMPAFLLTTNARVVRFCRASGQIAAPGREKRRWRACTAGKFLTLFFA